MESGWLYLPAMLAMAIGVVVIVFIAHWLALDNNSPWIFAVREIVDLKDLADVGIIRRKPLDLLWKHDAGPDAGPDASALCAQVRAASHRELPVYVMPHLLLGDKRSANCLSTLEAFEITHICNVAGRYGGSRPSAWRTGHYLQVNADDEEGYPILARHLDDVIAFIQRARDEGGRCLIHCQAGINRSGVLAIAALMLTEQLPVLEAVSRCKNARGVILSNHSFQTQLVALARRHGLLGQRPVGLPTRVALEHRQPRRSAATALRGL